MLSAAGQGTSKGRLQVVELTATRLTGEFVATADDGRELTVYVYTSFLDGADCEDPVIEGATGLATADGMTVKRLAKGTYQVVGWNTLYRSSSPLAP